MNRFERMIQVEKDRKGKVILKIYDKTGIYKIGFNTLEYARSAAKEWIRNIPIEDILFVYKNDPKLSFDSPVIYAEAFGHLILEIE